MSTQHNDFTEKLKALHTENGGSLEITSVQETNCSEFMLEIHAVSHDDPVLLPENDEEPDPRATGPWERREVTLVITLPCETGGCTTAELRFATKDADDAGNRLVSFRWVFDGNTGPGLAEMNFSDSATCKLDYFSVMPPTYILSFVEHCEQAYNDTF